MRRCDTIGVNVLTIIKGVYNMEYIANAWIYFIDQLKDIRFFDIIDILIVSVLFYYVIRFIRDRRAGKLAVGVVFLLIFQIIGELFNLIAVRFIMQNVFQVGILAVIVVFQPELRSMLENVGGESLKGLKSIGEQKNIQTVQNMIVDLCAVTNELSNDKTGALIVIEMSTKLGDVIKTGTIVNADMSSFLLKNIFFNNAPLHDGAVIIRDLRLYAAGCFLPPPLNTDIINKDLGTRHRAAIGVSEISDAVVIIVSEETGTISTAFKGKLKRNYDYHSLKTELDELLLPHGNTKRRLSKKKNDEFDTVD